MHWTADKLGQIPPVYRDALLAFKPIIDSRRSVVQITGIPIGHVYSSTAFRHNLTLSQVKSIIHNLVKEHLVQGPDPHGFYTLTGGGEDLVRAIAGEPIPEVKEVPPFPKLAS